MWKSIYFAKYKYFPTPSDTGTPLPVSTNILIVAGSIQFSYNWWNTELTKNQSAGILEINYFMFVLPPNLINHTRYNDQKYSRTCCRLSEGYDCCFVIFTLYVIPLTVECENDTEVEWVEKIAKNLLHISLAVCNIFLLLNLFIYLLMQHSERNQQKFPVHVTASALLHVIFLKSALHRVDMISCPYLHHSSKLTLISTIHGIC